VGQGIGVAVGVGKAAAGLTGGDAWAFLLATWAIISQPPIKLVTLSAATVNLAAPLNLMGLRFGLEVVFIRFFLNNQIV
jgi:hypothetical protein